MGKCLEIPIIKIRDNINAYEFKSALNQIVDVLEELNEEITAKTQEKLREQVDKLEKRLDKLES